MYIGLWSRVEGFERAALDRALERRTVVQGTLMRSTIHLVSARDYWPFAVAIREPRRDWWVSVSRRGVTAKQMAAAARKLRSKLGDGTMRRSEIHELLGENSVLTNGVNMWLDLVRVPPSGTWEQRRADTYALAEEWIGSPDIRPTEAMEHLVRSYLRGFGPAAAEDIADYCGLRKVSMLEPVLSRLELRRFEDEAGAELLDLPRAPLPDPETPAPARFLPTWDSTLLVHARSTGILPEEHRPKVFNVKTPQSTATFLVDGEVAGTWKWENAGVKLEPFGRLSRSVRQELREEADRLAELHA
jgi:hypothetical protein